MESKIKKTYRTVSIIFLPIVILLIMIFILLYNFGSTTEKIARSAVEEDLFVEAEDFAVHIQEELDIMTRMGEAFRDIMATMSVTSQKEKLQMIGALCDNSNAYMIVYSDKNGIGFTNTDIKVNVNKSGLALEEGKKEQYYTYLKQDRIMQAEAIVSVIPVVTDNEINGYILMYYSISHVRKLFEKDTKYENAFLLFSVDQGMVITSEGLEGVEVGSTLLEVLEKMDPNNELSNAKKAISNGVGASFQLTSGEESEYVICIPLEINDWYITIGYEKGLYEKRLTAEWLDTRTLITYLLVLIFAFIFVMTGITFVIYKIYNKHNIKLQEAADRDLLTGLYNKVTMENKIKRYMQKNANVGAILFILDVDDFKGINDNMGHAVGDEVLKNLGTYLRTCLGYKNIIGRAGGDEFVVFMIDLYNFESLEKEMQSVYHIVKDFSVKRELRKDVTFSVGAAWYPKDARNFEELFDAADQALYEAKKKGKNQLVQYGKR